MSERQIVDPLSEATQRLGHAAPDVLEFFLSVRCPVGSPPVERFVQAVVFSVLHRTCDLNAAVGAALQAHQCLTAAESEALEGLYAKAVATSTLGFQEQLVVAFLLSLALLSKPMVFLNYLVSIQNGMKQAGDAGRLILLRNFLMALRERGLQAHPTVLGQLISDADAYLSAVLKAQPWFATKTAEAKAESRPHHFLCLLAYLPGRDQGSAHFDALLCQMRALLHGDPDLHVHLLLTDDISFPGPLIRRYGLEGADYAAVEASLRLEAGEEVYGKRLHLVPITPITAGGYFPKIAEIVGAIDPDMILGYGGIFESVLWRAVLFEHFPSLFVPFNYKNPIGPSADLAVCLEAAQSALGQDSRFRHIRMPVGSPRQLAEGASDFVRPSWASSVVVSAMTGNRLEQAIAAYDDEFLGSFLQFFEDHPDVLWLFAGSADVDMLVRRDARLGRLMMAGRLRLMGFQSNLRDLYRRCDVYAHLPRVNGGSFGTIMATEAGLPVISFPGSDVNHLLDDDAVFPDLPSFYAAVADLCRDPERRRTLTVQRQARLRQHAPETGGGGLLALCRETIVCGHARLAAKTKVGQGQ